MLYTIAVVSDFHIGTKGRFRDTVTQNGYPQIDINVSETFRQLVSSENIQADLLLVLGDLSDEAKTEEFFLANNLIRSLARELGVEEGCIAGCPGNHDKNWKILENFEGIERINKWTEEEKAVICASYQNMIDTISVGQFCTPGKSDNVLIGDRYKIDLLDKVLVISYNSTWLDGVSRKGGHGRNIRCGYFHEEDAEIINKAVNDTKDKNDVKLTVVLLHHHPFVVDEPNNEPDNSILDGAESFYRMCADVKADIVLHGHKHLTRLESHCFDSRRNIPVLCAGGFCNRPEPHLQAKALNQFHLIEINSDDHRPYPKMGVVRSWSYCPAIGWTRSNEEFANFNYKSPFGNSRTQEELEIVLREFIDKTNHEGARGFTWSDVKAQKGYELQYVNIKVVEAAFETLKREGLIKVIRFGQDFKTAIVRN